MFVATYLRGRKNGKERNREIRNMVTRGWSFGFPTAWVLAMKMTRAFFLHYGMLSATWVEDALGHVLTGLVSYFSESG